MKVCVKCRREMYCKENGVLCSFGVVGHVYPGDLFKCGGCGNELVITNSAPSHFTDEQMRGSKVINMERLMNWRSHE